MWESLKSKANSISYRKSNMVTKTADQLRDLFKSLNRKYNLQLPQRDSPDYCEKLAKHIIPSFFSESIQNHLHGLENDLNMILNKLNSIFVDNVLGGFNSSFLSINNDKIIVNDLKLGKSKVAEIIKKTLESEINNLIIDIDKNEESREQNLITSGKRKKVRNANFSLWEKLYYISLFYQASESDGFIKKAEKENNLPCSRSDEQIKQFFKNQNKKFKIFFPENLNDRVKYCEQLVTEITSEFLKKLNKNESLDDDSLKHINRLLECDGGFKSNQTLSFEDGFVVAAEDLKLPDKFITTKFSENLIRIIM